MEAKLYQKSYRLFLPSRLAMDKSWSFRIHNKVYFGVQMHHPRLTLNFDNKEAASIDSNARLPKHYGNDENYAICGKLPFFYLELKRKAVNGIYTYVLYVRFGMFDTWFILSYRNL